MKPSDAVIIVNHEPHWVTRQSDDKDERNVRELMRTYLAGKVRVRLAGDLHHYTRHTPDTSVQKPVRSRSRSLSFDEGHGKKLYNLASSNLDHPDQAGQCLEENKPELIVSGGGGAFCHGTREFLLYFVTFSSPLSSLNCCLLSQIFLTYIDTFPNRIHVGPKRQEYIRVSAFPCEQVSFYLGWLNIFHFRWRNWRFDVVWAVIYIGIVSSLFPLCGIYGRFESYIDLGPLFL